MAEPVTPAADHAPIVPEGATVSDCIRMYLEWLDVCEQLVLSALRREIGPDGDLKAAYRRWYEEQSDEHYQVLVHMAEEFDRRGGGRGR
jgi:hypothetical protein